MKNYRLTLVSALIISLVLTSAQISLASVQPDGKDVVLEQLPRQNRSLAKSIADALGLGSIFDEVLSFLDAITKTNDKIFEARSPDWETINNTINGIDTQAKELSRQLENRTTDSYSINQDESEQIQRELIQEAVATTTTSQEAQKTLAASLVQIEDALKKSGDLSQNSARTDVSQQILQNISEQSGINTQLLGTIAAQNVQAQKDRANQIMLEVQQAQHNAGESTRRRREAAIANDLGITAWGTVATPLFLYEEENP
jgi:hypothetical protein